MDKIDYASLAKSRYTSLFAKDPVFDAIVQTIVEYKMNTQDLYINFANTILDIDKSTGNNLDLIGSIVGQPRVLVDFSVDKYFGFLGNPRAEPYDKGLWYSTFSNKGSDSRTLSDEEYRRIIKARIIRNNTNCSREDFIKILDLILDIDRSIDYLNIVPNSNFKTYNTYNSEVDVYKDSSISEYDLIKVTATKDALSPDTFYVDNKDPRLKFEAGKKYTMSMKASSSSGRLISSVAWDGSDTGVQRIFDNLPVSDDRTTPTKVNVVFTPDQDLDECFLLVGSDGLEGDWFEFSELMVREGELTFPDKWTPSALDFPSYTIETKTHGNINLNVYNYKGDLGVHFLSNFDKTGDLIPKPLGYKLSIMLY
ncbi:hypothetical protein vBAbaMD22_40 [Acinetobacter phage vB_AbaM_D22]|nr:hypothetical protein vBAbaMD22_40 [Acinetobacter phage vB_AbaM_D22]